jgi:hypothetical protein
MTLLKLMVLGSNFEYNLSDTFNFYCRVNFRVITTYIKNNNATNNAGYQFKG